MDQNNFGGQPNMNSNIAPDNDQTVLVDNDEMQNNYIQPQEFNNPNINQSYTPDMNQGYAPDMNQGYAPDMNQGYAPDMNQGYTPDMNQGFNQGYVPDMNQGFAPNMNQGGGFGMDVPFNGNPDTFNPNIPFGAPVNQEPVKEKKPKKKKKLGLIIAIIAVLLVAGGGAATYFLFFTPEKRLERKLDDANSALEDGDYEEAHELYTAALEIDDESLEAMLGDITALINLGDSQLLTDSYCTYMEKISECGYAEKEDYREDVLSMYYFAGDVYASGDPKLLSIYEEGYTLFPAELTLRDLIVEQYLVLADEAYQLDDFEAGIEAYDSALSYDSSNADATDGKKKLVQEELDDYMNAENYTAAEELIERFRDEVDGIDYDSYLARIETERYIIAMKHDVMAEAEHYLSMGDYESMLALDGSESANFVSDNIFGHYIYLTEGDQETFTGTASAMYNFGNGAYYFYYGDFENGLRKGYGVMFMKTSNDGTYTLYEGSWDNDLPNGYGSYSTVHDKEDDLYLTRVSSGNFTNGLADGTFESYLDVDDGETVTTFTGSFTATAGVAPDVSDTTDYTFNTPSGYIMYIVYENTDLKNAWGYWYKDGSYLGVNPFNK